MCPESTIASICFFWAAVNDTPTRCSAVMPLIGIVQRLPELYSAALRVLPQRDRHVEHDLVAWVNMSLPLPASFCTLVNVRSRFSPDWIVSSSTPVFCISDVGEILDLFGGDTRGAARST